ncbi:hypothetical protein AB0454_22865 [Streptomyces sp. NPDC093509]|uniref:hypothetical protein n=1 Tax=Streptomyces sp. NPDC093509 TaxID=3154982 RepID=UPI00344D7351
MSPVKIFGREPSAILGLVAMCVQFFSAFVFEVGQNTQTLINALAAAAVGLIVAAMVKDGSVLAAITGFAQAALALGMNLGLDWSTARQAAAMAAVTLLAQFVLVRDRVTAPVSAEDLRLAA